MGGKGKPRRPTALEELMGNPCKRKKNTGEPKPQPLKDTDPPAFLDAEAKKEWKRVTSELLSLGLLSQLDRSALIVYVSAWSDFHKYTQLLKKEPPFYTTDTGVIKPHPAIYQQRQAYQQVVKLCVEFGFTPAARARMNVTTEPAQKTPTLNELLNGGD